MISDKNGEVVGGRVVIMDTGPGRSDSIVALATMAE